MSGLRRFPFDLLCEVVNLQRGDEVYPVGHPEGEGWDVPLTPSIVKKVIAEEISFEPSCFAGHSGGGLFDVNWTLVGMITRTLGRSCEAISFERICATLEDDWGLVVNHEAQPLISTPPESYYRPCGYSPRRPRPQSPMSTVPATQVQSTCWNRRNPIGSRCIYVENTFEDRPRPMPGRRSIRQVLQLDPANQSGLAENPTDDRLLQKSGQECRPNSRAIRQKAVRQ